MRHFNENFLRSNNVIAIFGKPQSDQLTLAEQVAFVAAATVPVAFLVEDENDARNLEAKYAALLHSLGADPAKHPGLTIIEAKKFPNLREKKFNAAFFEELKKRAVSPGFIVLARAATASGGFEGFEGEQDLRLASKCRDAFGYSVLIAGHTPRGELTDNLKAVVDCAWHVEAEPSGNLILKDGKKVIKLGRKTVGGNGHVVTHIFEAMEGEKT